jgi:phosphatidylserine/phosphatidylglycerophosphate/cardiolipin synthase-like enzyme
MYEFISGREYPAKVIPLIEQTKNSIDIIVFDWRWYPQDPGASVQLFNQAIIRAARRGVKIRAITNNDEINKVLNESGINAKRIQTKKLMHCKLMIIDERIIITGSHNYTQSAFQMNLEYSVIIHNDNPEEKTKGYFNTLFSAA